MQIHAQSIRPNPAHSTALCLTGVLALAVGSPRPRPRGSRTVVTAARKQVRALDTPLSIARIGAGDITLTGATHSSEALNRARVMIHGSGEESPRHSSPVLTSGSCGASCSSRTVS
jgi:hypothetical protein